MSLPLHTVVMDGIGPQRSDRLAIFLASVSFPAIAASLISLGAITAGSGYTQLPVLSINGGTPTTGIVDPAVARATSLKLISATVANPGVGVAVSDTFNFGGGVLCPAGPSGNGTATAGVAAKVTATHIQVVTAVVNAAGSGGTPGPVTVTGTTGTGTKWQGTGVISAGGALQGPLTITVPGDYTATPTLAGDTITGGSLSGATVTLQMGALTLTVATAGGYTSIPAQGAAATDVVGSGTGVALNGSWGLGTAVIDHGGNYSAAPAFTVTPVDGNGTSAAVATGTLGGAGNSAIRQILVEGIPDPTSAFIDGNAWDINDAVVQVHTATKQSNVSRPSISVAVQPRLAASSIVAGGATVIIIA